MTEIADNETRRPCRFCRHYVRHDRATAAAVCLHVDRPRLNRCPETGCLYWELRVSDKAEWCAWVNEDFVRRMVDAATRRSGNTAIQDAFTHRAPLVR